MVRTLKLCSQSNFQVHDMVLLTTAPYSTSFLLPLHLHWGCPRTSALLCWHFRDGTERGMANYHVSRRQSRKHPSFIGLGLHWGVAFSASSSWGCGETSQHCESPAEKCGSQKAWVEATSVRIHTGDTSIQIIFLGLCQSMIHSYRLPRTSDSGAAGLGGEYISLICWHSLCIRRKTRGKLQVL